MKKIGLIRKLKLVANFATSSTGKQIITIMNFDNQTMNFGHLIEYDVRNIFLQKAFRKLGREISSRSFFFFFFENNFF